MHDIACGLQSSVNHVVLAVTSMGMRINKTKTEVQYLGKGKKEFQILWLMGNKYNKAIISFTWVETSVLKVEQMEISQEGRD